MEKNRKRLLIVVDAQNDFITGSLGSPEAVEAAENVKSLVGKWYKHGEGEDIYFTQDTHFPVDYLLSQEGKRLPGLHCVCGSWGWRIADGIDISVDETTDLNYGRACVRHLTKNRFGYDDWVAEELLIEKYDEIVLCGFCTDICVVTNALLLKTYYRETEMKVVADCCAGSSVEGHEAALKVMKSCQIDIVDHWNDIVENGSESWEDLVEDGQTSIAKE